MKKQNGIASSIKRVLDNEDLSARQRKDMIKEHNHHIRVAKGIREDILSELAK